MCVIRIYCICNKQQHFLLNILGYSQYITILWRQRYYAMRKCTNVINHCEVSNIETFHRHNYAELYMNNDIYLLINVILLTAS